MCIEKDRATLCECVDVGSDSKWISKRTDITTQVVYNDKQHIAISGG